MEAQSFEKLMDNFATSNEQLQRALEIIEKFSDNLKKWKDSSSELMELIQEDPLAEAVQQLAPLLKNIEELSNQYIQFSNEGKRIDERLKNIQRFIAVDIKESRETEKAVLLRLDELLLEVQACHSEIKAANSQNENFLDEIDLTDEQLKEILDGES